MSWLICHLLTKRWQRCTCWVWEDVNIVLTEFFDTWCSRHSFYDTSKDIHVFCILEQSITQIREVADENTGVQFAIEQIPTSVFKQCFRKTFESYYLVCIVQFICLSNNCINTRTICRNNDGAPRPGRQSSSLRVFCAAGQRVLQHRRYGARPAIHQLGPRASRELARISQDFPGRRGQRSWEMPACTRYWSLGYFGCPLYLY